jgi:hypothetical protein
VSHETRPFFKTQQHNCSRWQHGLCNFHLSNSLVLFRLSVHEFGTFSCWLFVTFTSLLSGKTSGTLSLEARHSHASPSSWCSSSSLGVLRYNYNVCVRMCACVYLPVSVSGQPRNTTVCFVPLVVLLAYIVLSRTSLPQSLKELIEKTGKKSMELNLSFLWQANAQRVLDHINWQTCLLRQLD